MAEGSVMLRTDGVTTFTFLHIEVAERLRGRGARLVARANQDGLIPEQDFSNNGRELLLDTHTDWNCGARTSSS